MGWAEEPDSLTHLDRGEQIAIRIEESMKWKWLFRKSLKWLEVYMKSWSENGSFANFLNDLKFIWKHEVKMVVSQISKMTWSFNKLFCDWEKMEWNCNNWNLTNCYPGRRKYEVKIVVWQISWSFSMRAWGTNGSFAKF